jgi:hypothetical protein
VVFLDRSGYAASSPMNLNKNPTGTDAESDLAAISGWFPLGPRAVGTGSGVLVCASREDCNTQEQGSEGKCDFTPPGVRCVSHSQLPLLLE